MKLDIDLSDLELAAAKMQGLDAYLTALQNAGKSYEEGLAMAKQFALDNHGSVAAVDSEGMTRITVRDTEAHCFQPYPDIDKFYFEI